MGLRENQMQTNSKIEWAKNYEGHASTAQSSIWHCIRMLSDFEPVEADVNNFDIEEVITGEREFYLFMKNLYNDMYSNPYKYEVPTDEYDNFIKDVDIAALLSDENFHKNKLYAKENKLRQIFQRAIQFYPDYFYGLGMKAERICRESYALIISIKNYEDVLKSLDLPNIRKGNEKRIQAIMNLGVEINEQNGLYHISCSSAPKMFLGLKVLCAAPEGKHKYFNYLRLDYKGYF
jgi:hypothetical protein